MAAVAAVRIDPRDHVKRRVLEELLRHRIRRVGQAVQQAFRPVLGHVLARVLLGDDPDLVASAAADLQQVDVAAGLCLGHQLLADALGGTCGPQKIPEIGVLEVELTDEGKSDPLFKGTAHHQQCLQWHSVRVAQALEGAVILAKSNVCSIQAMRIGVNAWSMQYHVEIESDTVENWGAIPAYAEALINTLG